MIIWHPLRLAFTPFTDSMNANSISAHISAQHVYAVSELNKRIKRILEERFPFIWISGEISNFKTPSSGHCYFTLKDQRSQISAVMFRGQAAGLKFRPEDGLSVIGLGRIALYEPRGSYQIIFEYLEPKGIGGLQIAFEKMKQRLFDEGLFDDRHKIALPVLPRKISIVTSPTGAAVRDFINVAQRRFPNLALEVVPVRVQGDRSPGEIVRAIRMLDEAATTDVIVLARGGGSIEDLWAFNDEQVARTIFACHTPIVSAVGHETDFTIADFVADLRAPTPSAAAEHVVPSRNELEKQVHEVNRKLYQVISYSLKLLNKHLDGLSSRIVHPRRRLQDLQIRLDDDSMRLISLTRVFLTRSREQIEVRHNRLGLASPQKSIASLKARIDLCRRSLVAAIQHHIRDRQTRIANNGAMLDALNPMAILQRGYSIARTVPEGSIVRSTRQVKIDQQLEVLLGKGQLTVTVDQKQNAS